MMYWLPWPDGFVVAFQGGIGRPLGVFSWMRAIP